MRLGRTGLAAIAVALLAGSFGRAADAVRFESLRGDKVFLREGPTYQHRILWVYRRRNYPVEVLASYESWRRIRDADGTIGWVAETMLSQQRTALVTGTDRVPISAGPGPAAKVEALAEPGVVVRLKACNPRACEVTSGDIDGWIDKQKIWGVGAGEVFQ